MNKLERSSGSMWYPAGRLLYLVVIFLLIVDWVLPHLFAETGTVFPRDP